MAMAQNLTVTGTVVDENNEPVIGASILVEGTATGTITDIDGNFTIPNVPASAKNLQVSFVGLKTQIVPITTGNIQIVLENDAEMLDEVMVVAYGTTTKASFTGSASVMRDTDMSAERQSLVKSFEGKVAGVRVGASTGDPGSDQAITIRGIGSVNGSTQPLYVVDGVPINNESVMTPGLRAQSVLSTINPDDIESMTVLKDAAASSLYGSRAANGVIIITTKKGAVGKTKVAYDAEFGWSDIAVQSALKMMNAQQLKSYWKDAVAGYYEIREKMDPADAEAVAQVFINTPWEAGGWFHNPDATTSTDWSKEVYRTGFTTNHQVGISGGSEKTQFYASFGYNKVNGTVRNREFERYSGRINLDHRITDWLKVGVKQMISFSSTDGSRDQGNQSQGFGASSALAVMYQSDPTAPVKLPNGEYNPNTSFGKSTNPNLMISKNLNENSQFLKTKTMRSMTNADVEVKLPFNFTARSVFSYDFINNKVHEFWAPKSIEGSTLSGFSERSDYTNRTMTSSTTLNYVNDFGEHHLQVLGGFEAETRQYDNLTASAKQFVTYKLPELSNGQPYNTGSSISDNAMLSWLANANYNFANKYYFSASFRRDGSSRLAVENRWSNFWSVSGAWRISGEKFLKDTPLFNDLKLRVSYGTNGNLPTGNYSYMGLYSTTGGYGANSAYYWSQLSNPKLGWEKSYNFNVGLDWNLFGRVGLTVEYYNKLTKAMLFATPISWVTGFGSKTSNLGKLGNSGLEVSISSQNIATKNFTWSTDFNITFQSNKIKELPNGEDVRYGDGSMYILREGESMHTFYLPQYVGVNKDTGLAEFWINPEDHSKGVTNYYTQAASTIVGKAIPDFLGGMTNRFTWKNFDLSFIISFQGGASMFDYPSYFLRVTDGFRASIFNVAQEVGDNYWTPTNKDAEYPRPIWNNPYRSDRFSTRIIRSTDNIRMRDITFGYRIPVKKSVINNLRVYFRATNPFIIYSATKNVDPDVAVNGYRQLDTPPTRSFVFGLNIEL
ncbi:MAG: TonB-dependent receptor [Bacteroidaceae bacterium]|nr:TonB-dependent receptor [Bacteroidaceae bacterium]